MSKNYILKLTSAVAFGGVISKAGELVEVTEAEAKNLLHRGKAVLATAEDGVEQSGEDDGGEDLSKFTKEKLLEIAKNRGVEIASGANKAHIIEAITAAAAGQNVGE